MNELKLREVLLGTHSFEALKAFYGSLLDMEIVEESPLRLSFRVGESVLAFQESPHMKNEFYHVAFMIPTNKFIEAKQWLINRGIPLVSRSGEDEFFFEHWNATAMYFYDPDHNLVEFIAHHTLDNAAVEAFEPDSLLRISEIGLPVDNVPEVSRKITEMFQLESWGGAGQQFTPLGEVEGLFIVVDKQRPWFPDDRIPTLSSISILFEGPCSAGLSLHNGLYELRSN
ncbi:VOC family protein [Paenibacillus brasilensis]|uniref:Catechol-2,3-dioxygenase n=1 Tax=Paenibacillus brasilensis TaxID=128574 RepID=A0ABU0L0J1_9BACL|nr:VOC family protein [Paenibacillus brasilensis]MDQ0494365.1 catechol-2,3-dioxygenase [Paenibacillus brasilensis]